MDDLDQLLNELKKIKASAGAALANNKETWEKIRANDLSGLGFNSKEEMQAWILDNPYANI